MEKIRLKVEYPNLATIFKGDTYAFKVIISSGHVELYRWQPLIYKISFIDMNLWAVVEFLGTNVSCS